MTKILWIDFAPLIIPLERRLQTLSVIKFVLSFLFGGFGCLLLCIYLVFTRLYFLPLLYLAWYVYDRDTPYKGGRKVEWFRRWTLWTYAANYFPLKLVKTVDIDPNKNYLFGYHPHGLTGVGAFIHFSSEGTNFGEIFPGLDPHLAILDGHFQFPLYRDYLMTSGSVSVTKRSIKWVLSHGKGQALGLIVGGAIEALEAHGDRYKLNLRNKKGFIKIALQTGASLVPVISFGENRMYSQMANPPGSRLRNFQDWMTKYTGFSPPIFHGRGIFQYSFGLLPHRTPVFTVVGAPIDVEVVENPSEKDIETLHGKYLHALCDLFEENKKKYGETDEMKLQFF